jgi:hypothetical protein
LTTYVSQEGEESTEHEKFVPAVMFEREEKKKTRRKRSWKLWKEAAIVLSFGIKLIQSRNMFAKS